MGAGIEDMLKTGDLQRAAAKEHVTSWNKLAVEIGLTPKALESKLRRERQRGADIPTFEQLKRAGAAYAQTSTVGSVSRWPNVAAFDAAETTPPLPAMPAGFRVRATSTLVDGETGETKLQWLKASAIDDGRAAWLDAIREACNETRFEPVPLPAHDPADMLAVFPVGDPHIGMLAWHEDAGENFDMDIAERNIVSAFAHLVERSPACREALLIFVGDNAHADSQANTTTKGTRVDADGRTVKMARRIVRTIRRAIDLVLAKHGKAHVIIERGNHDELLSAMLALALSLLYENEPRVSVDTSPEMYHWFRFGSVLIGTHHGDKAKPMDLLGVMAVDRAAEWSETKHRRFYCGHFHHEMTKEVPGIILHYLPTLASQDAWHRAMGYRSQRAMYMDVFHRNDGHVDRHYVHIDRVQR